MKNIEKLLKVIMLFAILVMACDPKDDNIITNNPSGSTPEETLNQGNGIQRDFMGRIVDESNLPISNVVVSIGIETATTDANGMFIINNANVQEKQAYIIAEKTGYLKGMKTLVPTQGVNTIRIMLVSENIIATVTTGGDSEVSLPNGTKVMFDGSFKDDSGNAYTGSVAVIMYYLDPSNPYIEAIMPGNMQAQNENNEERVLETYGMLNVELRGASGEKLNIADGHVAQIEIPMDPAQTGAPSTIPLWHFDETQGYWIQDGEATAVGGKYVAEVSHFSWWNCDAQFPTVTLCLNVVDGANNPLSNVRVELWRAGAVYPRVGFSNGSGEICGLIPANEALSLMAYDQCGTLVHSAAIGPFSSNTTLGNVVMPSVVSTTITGNLVDCSSANVTNGYVIMDYGVENASATVTNGSFAFSIIECPSSSTFNLEGVDYTSFQTTTVLPFNIAAPNVGNIIACNAVTEYVSLQVDSDPVEFYLTNISAQAHQQGSGFYVHTGAGTDGEWFYVGVNDTVLGTYSYNGSTGFSFEANINIDYNAPMTLQLNLTNYGAVGQYIDGTITGTYTDNNGIVKTLAVTIHVIRDL